MEEVEPPLRDRDSSSLSWCFKVSFSDCKLLGAGRYAPSGAQMQLGSDARGASPRGRLETLTTSKHVHQLKEAIIGDLASSPVGILWAPWLPPHTIVVTSSLRGPKESNESTDVKGGR